MKQIYLSALLLSVAFPVRSNGTFPALQKQVERIEYFIRKKDNTSIYQSPNRENGLNTTYTASAMRITPQDAAQQWAFTLTVKEVAGYKPVAQPAVTTHENSIQFDHDNHFKVEYVNTENGIQQNFTIAQINDENVTVKLQPETGWKTMYNSQTGLTFSNNDHVLTYQYLKVTDAKGKNLPARFTVKNNDVEVAIDAKGAVAPLSMYSISGEMHRNTAKSLLRPNNANANMGTVASKAGDINHDGYADIIVSAPNYSNGQGAVFVFYGSSPNGINPNTYTILSKNVANGHFGEYISGGGDLNGDGFDDVVVGAPYVSGSLNSTDLGAVYVYYGSAAGIGTTPEILQSGVAGDYYGISVAIVKDLNFDGVADLAIGASNSNSGAGMVYVQYGSSWGIGSGFSDVLSVSGTTGLGIRVVDGGDEYGYGGRQLIAVAGETLYVFDGSAWSMSSTPINVITTPTAGIAFGCSIAGAGDINGDNIDDIVVGAKDYQVNGLHVGAMYVYLGQSNTGLPTTPTQSIPAIQYQVYYTDNLQFGASLAFAGDINADGKDDIVVGEPGWENDALTPDEGVCYLYYGNNTWLDDAPYAQIQVDQANGLFGSAVTGAGDVNGDGYDDLLVCAKNYRVSQNGEGIGLIYLGGEYIAARMAAPAVDTLPATRAKASVKVFPNPTVSNLSVQYENLDAKTNTYIQLMNVNGTPVKTVQVGTTDNGSQHIDMSTLTAGTYFLLLNNGSTVLKEKIIKQ